MCWRMSHSLPSFPFFTTLCLRKKANGLMIHVLCVCDRFSTGTVGPTVFELGIKESFTVIIIVDLMYVYSSVLNLRYPK